MRQAPDGLLERVPFGALRSWCAWGVFRDQAGPRSVVRSGAGVEARGERPVGFEHGLVWDSKRDRDRPRTPHHAWETAQQAQTLGHGQALLGWHALYPSTTMLSGAFGGAASSSSSPAPNPITGVRLDGARPWYRPAIRVGTGLDGLGPGKKGRLVPSLFDVWDVPQSKNRNVIPSRLDSVDCDFSRSAYVERAPLPLSCRSLIRHLPRRVT